jgi:hypothetical protein
VLHIATDSISIPGGSPGAIVVAAPVVVFLTGMFIPIATGLVTRWTLPTWVKGLIMVVLNGVVAAVATATKADGTAVFSVLTLMTALWGIVNSAWSYAALWRPARLTSKPDGRLAPSVGVGPREATAP